MTGAGQNLDDLAVEVEKRLQETKQLGTQLTNLRQKMALKLEQAVRDQLAGLYMEKHSLRYSSILKRFRNSTDLMTLNF